MLVRLQSAIGRDNLVEQMILLPQATKSVSTKADSASSINILVAYNSSPNSHTALDLSLCIAHQTRLVTKAPVTVQVVYVIDGNSPSQYLDVPISGAASCPLIDRLPEEFPNNYASISSTPVSMQPKSEAMQYSSLKALPSAPSQTTFSESQTTSLATFEQAERIFWQARSLANEWQDSFKAQLRFGCVAEELRKVVETEAATLLFVGCHSVNHPIVQKLGSDFPCTVLGMPNCID